MTPDKVALARQMRDSKEHTTEAIAEVLGVSRASVYRHLADPLLEPPAEELVASKRREAKRRRAE